MNRAPENYTPLTVDQLQDLIPYRCSELEQQQLAHEISDDEIKKTIFAMHNDKSPGPDGYTSEFFKHSGKSVCVYYSESVCVCERETFNGECVVGNQGG